MSRRASTPGQLAERATRILDVAADLLVRHGYRRVTIDDVTSGAGIGKGTVYLHWRTREELFAAVLDREVLGAVGELVAAVRDDPHVALLHGLARCYFLAIMSRPLLRGLLLSDADLLGRLAHSRSEAHEDRHRLMPRRYFELLNERGLLGSGMDIDGTAFSFLATFEGFLRAETTADDDASDAGAGLDRRADLLAVTVRRAFESDRSVPTGALDALALALIDLLADLGAADRSDLGVIGS